MKQFKPLQDRILVKRIHIEKQTKGGIFLPDSAREKPLEGEVIAIGPGKKINNIIYTSSIKIGDKVLFAKYSEIEITIQGNNFLLLKEDDILGIIE